MPVDSPLKMQLAIQGGGAKIVALMAAMEAIDQLQTDGILRVTRIAGTSAGALVGAIYAAGPGMMKEARIRLQAVSSQDIARMFPSPFSPGNSLRLIKLLLWGHPFWRTGDIEAFLDRVLRNGNSKFERINQFCAPSARNIVLKIVSTNLSSAIKWTHEGDEPLIPSLMNSAGLPYCFRTWSKSGSPVIVDGGICENLPSDELQQPKDIEEFGKVVGITFSAPKQPAIDNAKRFSVALLEAAMQNSMQRAKQRLGDGYIFEIPTNIGTFEFQKALECVKEERGEYELIKKEALVWFEDFTSREKASAVAGTTVMIGDPWAKQSIEMMDKLGELYRIHHSNRQREFSDCSLVVTAKCLAREGDRDFGQPDEVKYSSIFRTKADEIACQRITVSSTTHLSHLQRTNWSWTDLSNQERTIKAIDLPMRSVGAKPGMDRQLLLFLDPPLPPESGPYRFEFVDLVQDFMKPLSEGRQDSLYYLSSPVNGTIKKVDLVLFIPHDTPTLRLVPRNESPGWEMNREELARYEIPVGYRSVGWTAQDVRAGTEVGMRISYLE